MSNSVKLINLGEVKTAKDGRAYYTAEFQDASNPFAKSVRRNFWQQFDANKQPIWKGADPAVTSTFVGKLLPGQVLTLEVEPYMIGEREVTIATTVVLGGELPKQVFKSIGHVLASAETAPVAEELAVI